VLPIQIADLRLSFHGRGRAPLPVLDGIHFDVAPGEFVSLLGPSGCGKSTLLHVVAGLLAPDAGSVRVGDEVIGPGSRTRPQGVGYVFQSPRLLNWLTVADNLAVVLEAAGVPRAKWDPLIDHYLDLVGLGAFKRHHPLELSGGMQHRVALVRALAIGPRVILMDEPLGALDAITARRVRDDLVRLCQESGATVLYVTHNIGEAVYLSDRVLLLYARPTRVYRDVPIPIERPRHHGDPRLVALENAITDDFFANVMDGAGEL
jgi:NitT/TauT family transport system ATP-binding protein